MTSFPNPLLPPGAIRRRPGNAAVSQRSASTIDPAAITFYPRLMAIALRAIGGLDETLRAPLTRSQAGAACS